MKPVKAFTLVEMLVVIGLIALLLGILIPTLSGAKKSGNRMKSTVQARSIQTSMVLYSGNNNGWYPLLNSSGKFIDDLYKVNDQDAYGGSEDPTGTTSRELVFWHLLKGAYFPPEELISPSEHEYKAYSGESYDPGTYVSNNFDSGHFYSYTLLDIDNNGNSNLKRYWRNNANGQAVIITDRYMGAWDDPTSLHSSTGWQGVVGWNDGHATFELDPTVPTRFDDTDPNPADDLLVDNLTKPTDAFVVPD